MWSGDLHRVGERLPRSAASYVIAVAAVFPSRPVFVATMPVSTGRWRGAWWPPMGGQAGENTSMDGCVIRSANRFLVAVWVHWIPAPLGHGGASLLAPRDPRRWLGNPAVSPSGERRRRRSRGFTAWCLAAPEGALRACVARASGACDTNDSGGDAAWIIRCQTSRKHSYAVPRGCLAWGAYL